MSARQLASSCRMTCLNTFDTPGRQGETGRQSYMSGNGKTKASDLFIQCLEEEGCEYVFGVPGEENLDFLDSLSRRSYDLANECLNSAETVFKNMEKQDRRGFLSLLTSLVELNWRDAKASFESGATILGRIDREQRGRFPESGNQRAAV